MWNIVETMTTLGLLVSVNSLYKGIWWYNGNTASGDVAMASIYSYTVGNYSILNKRLAIWHHIATG